MSTVKKSKSKKKPAPKHSRLHMLVGYSKRMSVLIPATIISYAIFGIALWMLLTQPPQPVSAKVLSSRSAGGASIFQPSPGNKYVIVDVRIVHHLPTDTWITPVTQSYITDQQGHEYQMAPYELNNPFDARSYRPGEVAAGQLSYQVDATAKGLKWCYVPEHRTPLCTKLPS